jgi:hypothetical protein
MRFFLERKEKGGGSPRIAVCSGVQCQESERVQITLTPTAVPSAQSQTEPGRFWKPEGLKWVMEAVKD